jgi:DNA-binding CsgD family transcriptional regulator
MYLFLILNQFFSQFFPAAPNQAVLSVSLVSFIGVAISSFLCPIFLPSPGKSKPLAWSITFVLAIIFPNVILRSLGIDVWANSMFTKTTIHILTGMLYPICFGLFLLIHTKDQTTGESKKNKFSAFLFALAIALAIFLRFVSLLLINFLRLGDGTRLADNPGFVISLTYNVLNGIIIFIGFCAVLCLVKIRVSSICATPAGLKAACGCATENSLKGQTDWPFIFRLIGLGVAYRFVNAILEMRMTPVLTHSTGLFNIVFLVSAVVFTVLALIAGRSINRFLRAFLLAAIAIFILLPCLILFENYSAFVYFMNFVVVIFTNLVWIIFTVAIIEKYSSGFWFYGLAGIIYFVNIFIFVGPMVGRYIPPGIEFTVLITGIATTVFLFLSLRIMFPEGNRGSFEPWRRVPKQQPIPIVPAASTSSPPDTALSLNEMFRKQGLSRREITVAHLLVEEGLDTKEISKRLFISSLTVKDHIANIYRKFGVKKRGEFMALFVRRSAIN